ncbi:MAG TPA: hypothetical protein VK700_12080 [Steroidobacteraceae bacterium]|jgi:hypothetical protein|nr:hypothetical protein [Steroidobacteraceae bacterium]
MRIPITLLRACCMAALALSVSALAQDQEAAPAQPLGSAPATSSGPIPIRRIEDTVQTAGGPDEPKYGVDASWVIAGYNDNEVIYSIIITNQDQRIIRCSTLLSGFYLENGTRHSVSDRQGVTIFPGKQSSAGHWLGMDQTSGATYKVTCRAVS